MHTLNKPSYALDQIKLSFNRPNKLNMTFTAMEGQYKLGFSNQDVVDAIQALTTNDFYKSMPPMTKSFSAWHDVYKSEFKKIKLYIKFQMNSNCELIVSFKSGK